MALTLYNTLTRRKEPFEPIDAANVRMYVCGPTVYDYAHIGNARPVIVFDMVFRLLRHVYGANHVTYVRNITDVDDKINARAAKDFPDLPLNEAIRRVTTATEKQFHDDIAALGVLPPTVEPRATEHIEGMTALCDALVRRGHAYVADGHVLFDVSSMADYGTLSNRSLEEMEAGARVEVAPYKKGPMDFVLWKPSKPGEPAWTSPCGIETPGRPGWHIECSAMSEAFLGPLPFDIHGGGIDLVFPHHENEIAQSCCAHGLDTMARVWLHNGFLDMRGEKMSKSLGNVVRMPEALEIVPGEAVRLHLLGTHYRQPADFSEEGLHEAKRMLDRFYGALASASASEEEPDHELVEALADDLNTPKALAILHERFGEFNRSKDVKVGARVKAAGKILGLFERPPERGSVVGIGAGVITIQGAAFGYQLRRNMPSDEIVCFIEERMRARSRKDFASADKIRRDLASVGVILEDRPDGTTDWRRV